jgi:hypothetical protein
VLLPPGTSPHVMAALIKRFLLGAPRNTFWRAGGGAPAACHPALYRQPLHARTDLTACPDAPLPPGLPEPLLTVKLLPDWVAAASDPE